MWFGWNVIQPVRFVSGLPALTEVCVKQLLVKVVLSYLNCSVGLEHMSMLL